MELCTTGGDTKMHHSTATIEELTFQDFCLLAAERGLTLTELLDELAPERASLELLE